MISTTSKDGQLQILSDFRPLERVKKVAITFDLFLLVVAIISFFQHKLVMQEMLHLFIALVLSYPVLLLIVRMIMKNNEIMDAQQGFLMLRSMLLSLSVLFVLVVFPLEVPGRGFFGGMVLALLSFNLLMEWQMGRSGFIKLQALTNGNQCQLESRIRLFGITDWQKTSYDHAKDCPQIRITFERNVWLRLRPVRHDYLPGSILKMMDMNHPELDADNIYYVQQFIRDQSGKKRMDLLGKSNDLYEIFDLVMQLEKIMDFDMKTGYESLFN